MDKLQTEMVCLDFMKRVYEAHRKESQETKQTRSIFGTGTTETVEELVARYTKNIEELEKRLQELMAASRSSSRIMVL